jgi:hypothetical protein
MNVGLLLVAHPGAASHYAGLLERLLGRVPLPLEHFELAFDADVDASLPAARKHRSTSSPLPPAFCSVKPAH